MDKYNHLLTEIKSQSERNPNGEELKNLQTELDALIVREFWDKYSYITVDQSYIIQGYHQIRNKEIPLLQALDLIYDYILSQNLEEEVEE